MGLYARFLIFIHILVYCTGGVYSWENHPLPLRDLHQYPLLTYLQDIAISTNGDIYMTTVSPDATIYRLTGATTETPVSIVAHKFQDLNAATGIIETQPGVFTFLAGKQGNIGIGIHGTFKIFELDTRQNQSAITELVHMSDAGLIVGVIPVPGINHTLLVSDSTLGKLYRVDTATGQYETVLEDPTMLPPAWAIIPFGIGGIQLHNGYLYFVASFRAIIHRIKFTEEGYPAPGAKVEQVLALRSIYIDNFVIGPDDTIWAMCNADNRLVAATLDGTVSIIAGAPDELIAAGVVAGAFGTLPNDTKTLYVTSCGGMLNPVNGTLFEGGKIMAVDTTSW